MPVIEADGIVSLGDHFTLVGSQFRTKLSARRNARLSIGDDCYINQGVTILAQTSIRLGNNVKLADQVIIFDGDFHAVAPGAAVTAPVELEDNVWVGARAVILKGVTIGAHSVVGAGAVVTRDVPPKTIVAGNPAAIVARLHCDDDWRRP